MPDCSRLGGAVLMWVVGTTGGWAAQQPPSLKQLLEWDTQRAKPAAAAPRVARTVVRPQLVAIYGPTGQRTVVMQLGTAHVQFHENQTGSLPPSSYELLGIDQHCAQLMRRGSKIAQQVCLRPIATVSSTRASPSQAASPTVSSNLPWPVKELP